MVMLFIEFRADIDVGDAKGITALMWAAKRDHPEICTVLLKCTENPAKRSLEGLSALDYAILLGNYASAYMIYEYDPQVLPIESYTSIAKREMFRYVNYQSLLSSLVERITISKAPNFFVKPKCTFPILKLE